MSDHNFTTPAARKPSATYDGRATAPKSSRYKRGRIGLGPPVRSLPSGEGDEEQPDDHESTFAKFDSDDLGLDLRLDSVSPPSSSPIPSDHTPPAPAQNNRPEQSTLAQLIQQLNVASARAQHRTLDSGTSQDRPSPLCLDHTTASSVPSPSDHSPSQASGPSPVPTQPIAHTIRSKLTPNVYTTPPSAAAPHTTLPPVSLPFVSQTPMPLPEATSTRSHPSPALTTATPNSLKSQSPGVPSPTNPTHQPSSMHLSPTSQPSAASLQPTPVDKPALFSHPLQAYPSPPLAVGPVRPAPQPSVALTTAASAQPIPPPVPAQPVPPDRKCLYMNGRPYTRLGLLGRGGSSKVYKVMGPDHRLFAIKKVALAKADPVTIQGYINEINLLRRLHQSEYIIRLIDAEVNHARGFILIGLECGEIDLAHILQRHQDKPLNLNFVRMYWEQMLAAVHAIHEQKIVHSDLKPANFLLVAGTLKLIDFGIAKAIANDTTNIHREHQIGTVNYMSPEAIEDTNSAGPGGRRCMKLGRASDVWSLGCILYQMVYGRPPFAHLKNIYQKLHAIPNPRCQISFPEALPVASENDDPESALPIPIPAELLDVMKGCLQRDSRQRPAIPALLGHPFLRQTAVAADGKAPQTQYPPLTPDTLNFVVRQVLQFVHHNPSILQHNSGALDRDVAAITQALLRSMAKP